MVLEYATRKKKSPLLLTVAIIVAAIALPAIMFYGHYHQLKQTPHPNITTITKSEKHLLPTTQSQFAFYSLLPKMEVAVPQPATTVTNTVNNVASTAPQAGQYLLQVASLQNAKDAERFRNHLSSLGLTTLVQTYQHSDGVTWTRVLVGPYNNSTDAEHAQEALRHSGMNSLLLKAK